MRQLWQVADFVRSLRRQVRFGELSRAPLRLLQLELREGMVECDWMARPADIWDAGLSQMVRDRNESVQTLSDAIGIRNLLFDAMPGIESAVLRTFRQPAQGPPVMIVLGTASREAPPVHRVSSLVMRAKLYGFCFCFEDGLLRPLQGEVRSEEYIS